MEYDVQDPEYSVQKMIEYYDEQHRVSHVLAFCK